GGSEIFSVAHQAIDVEQDEQPVIELAHTGDELPLHLPQARRRLDGFGRNAQDFGNRVHDEPQHRAAHLDDDDAGLLVVSQFFQSETAPQCDDGNHLAAQIDDPVHEIGRVWNASEGLNPNDLLHSQNVQAELLAPDVETDQLQQFAVSLAYIMESRIGTG